MNHKIQSIISVGLFISFTNKKFYTKSIKLIILNKIFLSYKIIYRVIHNVLRIFRPMSKYERIIRYGFKYIFQIFHSHYQGLLSSPNRYDQVCFFWDQTKKKLENLGKLTLKNDLVLRLSSNSSFISSSLKIVSLFSLKVDDSVFVNVKYSLSSSSSSKSIDSIGSFSDSLSFKDPNNDSISTSSSSSSSIYSS
ncbi:hypothetical protein BpHYR1_051880 [Brachionus plicatilis]|uniref:Uncharacterized protein n=1 Tax=Brachionus plicatilis TaxID=10195 RepID=A0A3M7RMA9_BRAPC|nr:hypothetical protein BpHYR1_051880 [Brachionus plicatilis]